MRLQTCHGGLRDARDVGDAAAADADGDRLSGRNAREHAGIFEGGDGGGFDVGDAFGFEGLLHFEQRSGQFTREAQRINCMK